jgi:RNA-directed DNA polymerase
MWLWIKNLNLAALPARATILANLFLHYAFDMWMARSFPHIPFERYADDVICHCKSADEAQALWSVLADRFAACELVLHPEKTKIVYCKDAEWAHGTGA